LKAGGEAIQDECDKISYCEIGNAVITSGGKLRAKWVIHAVGPIWRRGNSDEAQKLRSAFLNSLRVAGENGITSIAFPAISAGIFGFPIDKCANILIQSTIQFSKSESSSIERIVFCLYRGEAYKVFEDELNRQMDEVG
jgi:O-acetyl-ADP-ribose deacetylase (regulator of RNase III)